MKSSTKIKTINLNFNITNNHLRQEESLDENCDKLSELVSLLRIIGEDSFFKNKTVQIPDDCEKYGFAEGKHDLPNLLYFLADMLEE